MTQTDPILAAITAHRAAYDAFQVAPEGDASILADEAYREAGDVLIAQACTTAAGAAALLQHLRWWLVEEAAFAESYGLTYRAAQVRVADLTALACACWPVAVVGLDPIHQAIATAETAEAAHTAALSGLDESNEVQMRRANAAADASSAAFQALTFVMPTSRAGLYALAEFYARESEEFEPMCAGGQYLQHLAAAMKGSDSTGMISGLSPAKAASDQRLVCMIPRAAAHATSSARAQ
ncbi:hypothetical protein SAMN02799631_04371 [Methylobacterium sp. 174MFSha1.1]|uniref:hypothetical protein n=1 Tax=Methylobacterium sp. 174MFSha1.1 TaxID=1502749 RepID=UPI0008E31860|nr:hypothetical protein [Methylobacterium sp. 174MFSha1.1]SFV06200.1 hypothetical protein SAMN02799631_04371 [Methylobacterium sp. 174MFSha1.1]